MKPILVLTAALTLAGSLVGFPRASAAGSYDYATSNPDWVVEAEIANERREQQRRHDAWVERRQRDADIERAIRRSEQARAEWKRHDSDEARARQAKLDRWDEDRQAEQARRHDQVMRDITRR